MVCTRQGPRQFPLRPYITRHYIPMGALVVAGALAACATNPLYRQPTAWQNPTQVRLGARVSF